MKTSEYDGVYVFDLHLLCGGYAYFTTVTECAAVKEHGRDVRRPVLQKRDLLCEALTVLDKRPFLIDDEESYHYWLTRRGWAIALGGIATNLMPQWLKGRACLKDAVNTYVDIEIAAPMATRHRVEGSTRDVVQARDGNRCLICARRASDGVPITMHHVSPHSRGGETTSRNLVALCGECNEALGTEIRYSLYDAAGLPCLGDLGLNKKSTFTEQSLAWVHRLSDNLMHSRCKVH